MVRINCALHKPLVRNGKERESNGKGSPKKIERPLWYTDGVPKRA